MIEIKKFYLTTSIFYASDKPHIGNTYEMILADAIARYKRLMGYDVYFQTGADEHGQKTALKAKENNKDPKSYVDEITSEIKAIMSVMNINYDAFIRTSSTEHKEMVAKIFKKLYDQGDIYKGKYEGLYCLPCESFVTEAALKNGKCPDCNCEVQKTSEEAYFLKLNKYVDRLIDHIEANPNFLEPIARKNEMINNFLKPGLQDLCVSRTSFDWGIKVDFDDDHVIYVWLDALSNYITFLGYDVDGHHDEHYLKYWPADIHLIGKDIFRFHALYWPIILMALGQPLPKRIFGHNWLLMGGAKMSKSKGNTMYADHLVSLFGVDAIRYYILSEMPYASDGVITYDLIIDKINGDLANNLGNLIHRTINMSYKYFNGEIRIGNSNSELDQKLISLALKTPVLVDRAINDLHISRALEYIFDLIRACNKYIEEAKPWVLAKNQQTQRLETVIFNLLESIRFIATLIQPFMPDTADKIFWQLNTNEKRISSLSTFGGLKADVNVKLAEPLFMRIDKETKLKEIV